MSYSVDEELLKIKLTADLRGNARSIAAQESIARHTDMADMESVIAQRKGAAIQMRWVDLKSLDLPHGIAIKLGEQRTACHALIESKNRRIFELLAELTKRDADFIDTLRSFDVDFEDMVEKVHEALKTVRDRLSSEYLDIDKDVLRRRLELNEVYRLEIEALLDKRRESEENEFIPAVIKTEVENEAARNVLRDASEQQYLSVKSALCVTMNDLEQQIEKVQTHYLINREKLEYNISVLTEEAADRTVENYRVKQQIVGLRGVRNKLAEDLKTAAKTSSAENRKLALAIAKLTSQYAMFTSKLFQVESINAGKFAKIWKSDETELRRLIETLMCKIKGVYQRVLGVEWTVADLVDAMPDAGEHPSEAGKSGSVYLGSESSETKRTKIRFSENKLRQVLELVESEMKFIIADESAAPGFGSVRHVLDYLGVETAADMDLLVSMFYSGQDEDDEELYVEPGDVLELMKEYVTEKENRRIADVGGRRTRKAAGDDKRKLERIEREEMLFWERLSNSVPEKTVNELHAVHGRVERLFALGKRADGLRHRQSRLMDENRELKDLFKKYLGADLGLLAPPTVDGRILQLLQ